MDCTFVCLAGYRASTTSSTVRASPEKRLPTKISAQGTDTGNGEYFLADLRQRPKGTCFGYHVFARLISKSLSYYVFFYNMSDAAAIVSCDLYSYLRCILGRSFRPGLIWTIHPTRESKRGHDRRLPHRTVANPHTFKLPVNTRTLRLKLHTLSLHRIGPRIPRARAKADIELAQPKNMRQKGNRHTDPVAPNYELPSSRSQLRGHEGSAGSFCLPAPVAARPGTGRRGMSMAHAWRGAKQPSASRGQVLVRAAADPPAVQREAPARHLGAPPVPSPHSHTLGQGP